MQSFISSSFFLRSPPAKFGWERITFTNYPNGCSYNFFTLNNFCCFENYQKRFSARQHRNAAGEREFSFSYSFRFEWFWVSTMHHWGRSLEETLGRIWNERIAFVVRNRELYRHVFRGMIKVCRFTRWNSQDDNSSRNLRCTQRSCAGT